MPNSWSSIKNFENAISLILIGGLLYTQNFIRVAQFSVKRVVSLERVGLER